MMNILFFLPDINNKGGVERATITLLNNLVLDKTNKIFLLVFDYNNSEIDFELDKNITVLSLGITNYKTQFFTLFKRMMKVIKENNISHFVTVETMSLLFSFFPLFILKKRPKVIVWEHFNFYNDNGKKIRFFLRKLSAKHADLIITLTERDANTWRKYFRIESNITSIFNISPFVDIKNDYNLSSRKAISIGRFVDVKGFDRLIQAWSILENKYDIGDWELSIIGYGELKQKLQNLINSFNSKSIHLVDGSVSVMNKYKEASFYCMTSYFEGLPMVLIEAQSFSLPAISFDIYSGPFEILGNGSGLLIKDNDIESYAEGLYKLITSEVERKKLSDKAFSNSENFNGKKIANLWLHKLQNL